MMGTLLGTVQVKYQEYLIQPLKRPMKVNLNPARCGCDVLSVILSPPPLHKAHPGEKQGHISAGKNCGIT